MLASSKKRCPHCGTQAKRYCFASQNITCQYCKSEFFYRAAVWRDLLFEIAFVILVLLQLSRWVFDIDQWLVDIVSVVIISGPILAICFDWLLKKKRVG
jgi:hypothetical protein